WLHPNNFSDLAPGRVRYRIMCDDAGILLDDGVVARLGAERFLVTTATGTIDAIEQWLEWWLAGSGRCAHVANLTGALGAVNLGGLVKLDKPDFVGRDALRAVADRELAERLVGFEIVGVDTPPGEGAAIVEDGRPVGRVTSAKWSGWLGRVIGLAWVPAALAG